MSPRRQHRVGRAAFEIMDAEFETTAREICREVSPEVAQSDESVAQRFSSLAADQLGGRFDLEPA
jgi:hypothetical protein